MKYIKRPAIVMSLLSTISFSFAQNSDSLKAFYPLQVGNLWQYEDQSVLEIETHKIVNDTLINDRRYYIFSVTWSNNFAPTRNFFRTINDSLWILEYLMDPSDGIWKEVVVYKLNARAGESWDVLPGFPTSLDSVGLFETFNSNRNAIYFGVFNGFFVHQEVLAESLGFVARFGQGEVSTTVLQGAIIDGRVFGNVTKVPERHPISQPRMRLYQCYPNPFNSNTVIQFETSKLEKIDLSIYNMKGEKVNLLFQKAISPGQYKVVWDGKNSQGSIVSTGVYVVRMTSQSGLHFSTRVVFVK